MNRPQSGRRPAGTLRHSNRGHSPAGLLSPHAEAGKGDGKRPVPLSTRKEIETPVPNSCTLGASLGVGISSCAEGGPIRTVREPVKEYFTLCPEAGHPHVKHGGDGGVFPPAHGGGVTQPLGIGGRLSSRTRRRKAPQPKRERKGSPLMGLDALFWKEEGIRQAPPAPSALSSHTLKPRQDAPSASLGGAGNAKGRAFPGHGALCVSLPPVPAKRGRDARQDAASFPLLLHHWIVSTRNE